MVPASRRSTPAPRLPLALSLLQERSPHDLLPASHPHHLRFLVRRPRHPPQAHRRRQFRLSRLQQRRCSPASSSNLRLPPMPSRQILLHHRRRLLEPVHHLPHRRPALRPRSRQTSFLPTPAQKHPHPPPRLRRPHPPQSPHPPPPRPLPL